MRLFSPLGARCARGSARTRPVRWLGASWLLGLAVACGGDTPADPGPPPPEPPPAVASRFVAQLPDGWQVMGGDATAFEAGSDSGVARSGRWSAALRSRGTPTAGTFLALGQSLNAEPWRGRRVRLRGWIRTAGVSAAGATLWLRVDGAGTQLALDNMASRPLAGTADWRPAEIVVDVPAQATGLVLGPMLIGGGTAWYDDLTLEPVGAEVPVTTTSRVPAAVDTAAAARQRDGYARQPGTIVAAGFERGDAGSGWADAVAWLRRVAVPLAGAAPGRGLDDLAPVGAMIGDARLVGLGEGTHGTREHFQLKHRLVEYLVRERGFTAFAIEATWPEANAVDRWVRGAEGDPAVLLSNLYFWTWNTEEVLELLRWLRAHNATVPAARQVRFFGFDMQAPGAAIDTVRAFVGRVDAPRAALVDSGYRCLAAVRNRGPRPGTQPYAAVPVADRAVCARDVAAVHALLVERAGAYAAASSAEEYARARQSARLVVQWEDMAGRDPAGGGLARDRYMAENTDWLLAQLPAGARMVLWAHNYHVSALSGAQGGHLRARHGAGYVNVGFTFGTGSFSAVEASGGRFLGLRTLATTLVPATSFEAFAQATALPFFVFDARRIGEDAAARPLAGPLPMRSIGSVFDASRPEAYFTRTVLPGDFDLVAHVQTGSATRLLPFRFE